MFGHGGIAGTFAHRSLTIAETKRDAVRAYSKKHSFALHSSR